jgi:glycosyltransferase involved in cell wall biosynthesis
VIVSAEFPSIDVVIPSIGRRTLEVSLESVFNQTILPKRVIVVDDSESQSLDLKNFDFPIDIVKTGGRKGPASARNSGILCGSSEWIALLDDDDYWSLDHLRLITMFAKRVQADIAVSSAQVGRSIRPKVLMNSQVNPLVQLYGKPSLSRTKFYFPTPGIVFKREVFEKIQFRSEMLEREDLMFLSDAFQSGFKIVQSPDATAIIKPHSLKSVRRTRMKSDIEWSSRLNEIQKRLGYKFLLGIGLRNTFLKLLPSLAGKTFKRFRKE